MVDPRRGDIWWADLNPTQGREQAGRRPVLVVSVDTFNQGPRGLVMVLPMTRTMRAYPLHVVVAPPESGLPTPGAIMCEQLRSISRQRLLGTAPAGQASSTTLARVAAILSTLLELPR